MAGKIKVAVSPFYYGGTWTDEVSGITFDPTSNGQINIYDVTNQKNLDGIRRALRMNILFLIEGSLDYLAEQVKVEEKVVAPEPEEVTPVLEEEVVEAKETKTHHKHSTVKKVKE